MSSEREANLALNLYRRALETGHWTMTGMDLFSIISAKWTKLYLNYSMVTALYMMEPVERVVINTIVLIMLTTMLYSSWVYLPHYTLKTLAFMGVISAEGLILEDSDNLVSDSGF